jgi:hypothetical protein
MLRGWITVIEAIGLIGLILGIAGDSILLVPSAILVGTALIATAIVETRK